MMREKSSYSFLRSLAKGKDHSFFKDLTGVFCTIGRTLVYVSVTKLIVQKHCEAIGQTNRGHNSQPHSRVPTSMSLSNHKATNLLQYLIHSFFQTHGHIYLDILNLDHSYMYTGIVFICIHSLYMCVFDFDLYLAFRVQIWMVLIFSIT
jgi:hypothetical protein